MEDIDDFIPTICYAGTNIAIANCSEKEGRRNE